MTDTDNDQTTRANAGPPAVTGSEDLRAGEQLNLLAEMAEQCAAWTLANVTPIGSGGISAQLIIPSTSGGGWLCEVNIIGNAIALTIPPNDKHSEPAEGTRNNQDQ